MAEIKSATYAHHMPYAKGQPITLTCDALDGCRVVAKIIEVFQPSTLSCVMTVDLSGTELAAVTDRAVLKVYDRRFAPQMRTYFKIDPWTEEREAAYLESVASGEAVEFLRKVQEVDGFEDDDEDWSVAEWEAYLHGYSLDIFSCEAGAYKRMVPLQGKQIPKFYSAVTLPLDPGNQKDVSTDELLTMRGILIEYIPGPTLRGMMKTPHIIPQETWQSIGDQACQVVRSYAHTGVLNKDVRIDNFIVNTAVPDGDEHRVVMIDFGLCEFRRRGESDLSWGRMKWREDEENAIGYVLQSVLRVETGFELKYDGHSDWKEYVATEANDWTESNWERDGETDDED